MVAISATAAGKFISTPPKAVRGFLFHGSDVPQIGARSEAIVRKLAERIGPDAEIVRLHDADLASDPGRLEVELGTGSLFGGTKIIWITALPAKAHSALADLILKPLEAAFLVVQAADVKKSHKILQAFEAAPYLAAIPSYGEDRNSLSAAMREYAASEGYELSQDAAAEIAMRSGLSALIARAEVDKLICFAGAARRITLDDVEACLIDQQTAELSEIADLALKGDEKGVLRAFDRFISSEQNVTPVLVVLSAALLRLHTLRAAVDRGTAAMQAIRDFRPPVFFKQQDALAAQIRRWPEAAIARQLSHLNETIKLTRLQPGLAEDLTEVLLVAVAQAAKSS